jgi:predicted 2-oxoglutarate/Fe(II)-dependent dioxygenase YbiX
VGIGILEDFLSPAQCRSLLELADTKVKDPFKVKDPQGNIALDQTRVCDRVVMAEDQILLDELTARAWEHIVGATGTAIEFFEEPQLLKYTKGGFYYYHVDSSYLVPAQKAWRKAVDRDLSLLIYLKGDFAGGELEFSRLNYCLRPKAGMLAWFPSDLRYEHAARPVTSGTRYAIVSWAAAVGVERVQGERALRSIDWQTREKNQGPSI